MSLSFYEIFELYLPFFSNRNENRSNISRDRSSIINRYVLLTTKKKPFRDITIYIHKRRPIISEYDHPINTSRKKKAKKKINTDKFFPHKSIS